MNESFEIPSQESVRSEQEQEMYEKLKAEFVDLLHTPASTHITNKADKMFLNIESTIAYRDINVYFTAEDGEEKSIPLKQALLIENGKILEAGIPGTSTAEQIQRLREEIGTDPTVIEYIIGETNVVEHNVVKEEESHDEHVILTIPYEEVAEEIEKTVERIKDFEERFKSNEHNSNDS